jgi:hypothetical protein
MVLGVILYNSRVFVDQSSSHATALYEYLGTYDLSASENVMTNPKVIDKLKTGTRKPKQMYTDMNLNNSLKSIIWSSVWHITDGILSFCGSSAARMDDCLSY